MEDDRLSVRIAIADRIYPLKIARNNEEKLRRAAKLINDELAQYRDFSDRDTQDKLAISALQFVFRLIDMEENTAMLNLQKELSELEQELDSYIDKQVL